jgi:hypothetical protein
MKSLQPKPTDSNKTPDTGEQPALRSEGTAYWDAAIREATVLMQRTRRLLDLLKKLIAYFRTRRKREAQPPAPPK